MKPIRLSVRKIVELVLRCGDIDSRYVDSSAMQNGAKAHRKIQKSMGENYQKEVSLRVKAMMDGIPASIFGRADGVITEPDGGVTIDEIKTTTLPLERIYEQRELHIGQAKCYAYMFLQTLEEPPQEVSVQVTYFQLESEELKRYKWTYSREELDAFFADLLQRYSVWLHYERDWKELRNSSIKAAGFPFESYRKGQRELAVAAYRTIEKGKKLYAQAPTGIGKTLSALFPSIKAVGEDKAEKLFYLTAKTVIRAVAEDAVNLMLKNGLRFKSITLRAKDKICFCEETVCTPDYCGYARGHYDRVNGALLDMLRNNDLITPDVTVEYAKKHMVCPHEFALDAALWADLVICDYNHVFDPTVYLRRFFNDDGGDYVFLIDEAHNLVDRVRDMYSVTLGKSSFYRIKKELKDKKPEAARLRKSMSGIDRYFIDARKRCGEARSLVSKEADAPLTALVIQFVKAAEEWLASERHHAHPMQPQILELYFEAAAFAMISELYDERYATITELTSRDIEVTLFCLDPSQIIGEALRRANASILFSATLTPLPYYREILGGEPEDFILSLASPFDQDRLLLMAHHAISTKYADRPGSLRPIAEAIRSAVSGKRGNYLIYFPSYEYMSQVCEIFVEDYPDIPILVQQSKMDEDERARFLLRFDAGNTGTLAGFCVLGGIFSEGIDLKGERLIGSVIVGVGLPKISLRQDLIKDYFNGKNGAGYDYAYVFPGMNKVLQAAGRVIRSETDYGAVLLIDSRFNTAKYRGLYPAYWSGMRMITSLRELDNLVAGFEFFRGDT